MAIGDDLRGLNTGLYTLSVYLYSLVQMVILPLVTSSVGLFLNFVALYYDTTYTMPFVIMLQIFSIWLFGSLPLTVVGTILGRHCTAKPIFPCRVSSIPRPIPEAPFYGRPLVIVALAGVLPFGSIFIEMYFIFTSFWNYKQADDYII